MDLDQNAVSLLASVAVDLNAVASTTIWTVPVGKKLVADHVKLRDLSADAANAVATIGKSTAKTDFVGAQTLSNLSAAAKAAKIQPVPSATPAAIVEYVAGDIVVIDVTTPAGGACTCTAELFGKLTDA